MRKQTAPLTIPGTGIVAHEIGDEIIGENIGQIVANKARYGHRTWVMYLGRDGLWHGARATADTLKRAMLATGTKMADNHSCTIVGADGNFTIGFWWLVNNMRRQYMHGYGA